MAKWHCEIGFYRTIEADSRQDAQKKAGKMKLSAKDHSRWIVCKKVR